MSAFTIRLSDDIAAQLDLIASKLDRSRSFIAAEAIKDYVTREAWQLADIEAGLEQAKRGEFATDADLADVINKFRGKAKAP